MTATKANSISRNRTTRIKTLRMVDLFCGAGGTSEGADQAFKEKGLSVQIRGVNHWEVARDTHRLNHPEAEFLCTGIESVNPLHYYRPGQLYLLWASPECTHHSNARGGKPMNDQSRASAFCVLNWINALLPPVVLVENVPEFLGWGPLDSKGRPIKKRKGEQFRAWVAQIEAAGYRVEWKILCCADYGDPTTRERLFVQCVRGRRPIAWPAPTHAEFPDQTAGDMFREKLKPWVPARDIIDWSIRGQLLTERKKPLVEKTMDRILAGFFRQLQEGRPGTFIVPNYGERDGQAPRSHDIDEPLPSVTSHGAGGLVEPFLLPVQSGEKRTRSIKRPLQTVTCDSRGIALVAAEPMIIKLRGTSASQVKGSGRKVGKTLGTITAGGIHDALVEPIIITIDQQGRDPVSKSAGKPLTTVTTKQRHAIAEPFLVQTNRGNGKEGKKANARRARKLSEPFPTVTCAHGGEYALLEPEAFTIGQQSGATARPVGKPLSTIATAGAVMLIEPMVVEYYGTGKAQTTGKPLGTVTTKHRFALVLPVITIGNRRWLVNFRFRMLQPHELAGAQGFPKRYKFSGTKTDQVRQIGNAVPCNTAKALVRAVLKAGY